MNFYDLIQVHFAKFFLNLGLILRNDNLMRKLLILFIAITSLATAQKKDITIDEIWNGTFRTEQMNSLNSMNGDFYSLQNFNRTTRSSTVDKYSYTTLEKIKTIGDSYMAASGVPNSNPMSAKTMVNVALEMMELTINHNNENEKLGKLSKNLQQIRTNTFFSRVEK